jgi:hypothetical protein
LTDPRPANQLPAYHINRDLIHPDDYAMTLKGAVATITFNLTKQLILGEFNCFAAHVLRIDVLEPPNPSPMDADVGDDDLD